MLNLPPEQFVRGVSVKKIAGETKYKCIRCDSLYESRSDATSCVWRHVKLDLKYEVGYSFLKSNMLYRIVDVLEDQLANDGFLKYRTVVQLDSDFPFLLHQDLSSKQISECKGRIELREKRIAQINLKSVHSEAFVNKSFTLKEAELVVIGYSESLRSPIGEPAYLVKSVTEFEGRKEEVIHPISESQLQKFVKT